MSPDRVRANFLPVRPCSVLRRKSHGAATEANAKAQSGRQVTTKNNKK